MRHNCGSTLKPPTRRRGGGWRGGGCGGWGLGMGYQYLGGRGEILRMEAGLEEFLLKNALYKLCIIHSIILCIYQNCLNMHYLFFDYL